MRRATLLLSACTIANAAPTTGAVVGIVTDGAGPVAHAKIRLATEGRDPIYLETDGAGKYRIDALDPGGWVLAVSELDHVTSVEHVDVAAGGNLARDVTLRDHPRGVVEGVVTDAVGPVQGARVEAVDAMDALQVATTVTTADGHYALAVGDSYVNKVGMNGATVVVRRAGSAPLEQAVSFRRGDIRHSQNFSLMPGGSIAGVVRDAKTHAPVAYATIAVKRDTPLRSDLAGTGASRTIAADRDGHFELDDLIPSTYELSTSPAVLVTVGTAEHVAGVEVVVAKRR